ncbi:MAG: MBL fold metallo-hydrolase [Oscillospiraceae bacterium]
MKKRFVPIILSVFLLFTGCSTNTDTSSIASNLSSETASVTSSKPVLVLPTTENTSGKVQIQTVSACDGSYLFNSYIITSSKGESVVVDPTRMPRKNIIDLNPAAIVSTHGHPDHIDPGFTDLYDSKKNFYTKEDFNTNDFHIYTMYSSHSSDLVNETTGNVIIVLEVDGLRIAHMGDIGQTKLTAEQLKALGNIDIAFMQFQNSYSDMSLENEKGFKLIEQLNPKIVIPTHYTALAFPIIEKKYGKITEYNNILQISKEDLPEKALTFYHILNTHSYY